MLSWLIIGPLILGGKLKARLRGDAVHVARDRFDDDTGDRVAVLGKGAAESLAVVVGQRHGVICQRRRYAW